MATKVLYYQPPWVSLILILANLSMYQELLSEGSKFEITREYQELRTIITEAQKFDLLISEIFVDSTRPCMTRDELSSLCTKVLNLPFKLKNSDLLIKVRSSLIYLVGDN